MRQTDEGSALSHAAFWDARYSQAKDGEGPTHEWLQDFTSLQSFFKKHLFLMYAPETNPRILHLGSGDSTIPYDLLKEGYTNQICLDFSTVVVDLMKSQHTEETGVKWIQGDLRDMVDIASSSVDVGFDKSTLDAMIFGSPWNPPDEVLENSRRYMKEVQRVLKEDGVFLYITYRQPHFMRPIFNHDGNWALEMDILGGGETFEYYGYKLSKQTAQISQLSRT